jgi:hypothetical protein
MVVLAAFFVAAWAAMTLAWWAPLAILAAALYALQLHFLSNVGAYRPKHRLQIWRVSLAAHVVVLVAAYAVSSSAAFILLLPESISALLHLIGIHHASRSLQAAA